jgi:hypothetical protein
MMMALYHLERPSHLPRILSELQRWHASPIDEQRFEFLTPFELLNDNGIQDVLVEEIDTR